MIETIKDYLISLGFSVNSQSLAQARQAMRDAEGFVSRFAGSSTVQFTIAGAAVTTFVVAANAALASFMNQLAQTDLRNQMFARQMYTTADNAGAVTNSLNAMGRSLEELYLSPELIRQFQQLRQQSFAMRPPEEYKQQMQSIRAIAFEFTRLKLEATYAMQWIGYYLFKYLEGPIKNIKIGMKDFNDTIVKNMPVWTKQVAQVVSWVARLGIALFKAGEMIFKLFRSMPTELKLAGSAFLAFFTLLKMGPIGWLIAGLTAILGLIDDYATFERGGESAFAGIWRELDKFKDSTENQKIFKELIADSKELVDNFTKLVEKIGELLDKLAKLVGFKNFKDLIETAFMGGLRLIDEVVKSINLGLESILSILNKDFKQGFKKFAESIPHSINGAAPIMDFADGGIMGVISGYLKGNITDKIMGYVMPQAYHKRGTSIEQNITNHIYGSSDPYATAMAVNHFNSLNIGNHEGLQI